MIGLNTSAGLPSVWTKNYTSLTLGVTTLSGEPANVFSPIFAQRVWLNMEVDSPNRVGMLFHYGLNFESFLSLGVDFRENQWHHLVSREFLHEN